MPRKIRADMPVQSRPCRTCPFEGEDPIDLEPDRLQYCTGSLVNLEASHLCHSANNKKICRGGRTIQLRVLTAMGLIDEPTDEAFAKACEESKRGEL
mgnify:CR=1 FL=1